MAKEAVDILLERLQLSEPFVVNDTEYVSVTFVGQSFMLHQIVRAVSISSLAGPGSSRAAPRSAR